ncbi:MAG: recombinase family protein [Pseudomonadota bacterium]|nr:recombinase family protein [Pseudomonadota bacterium]
MLVGYMRVSSESDRQNTNLQRDALQAAGVDIRHLFEDRASGAKDDRPGLTKALEFVRPGDVLVVWKLDRLGRSLPHLLSIVNTLKDRQVAFRSLTEGMDTTTASGELLFHVFGALAQYERALTKERVTAGLAAARRRGRVGGRPPAIWGARRIAAARRRLAATPPSRCATRSCCGATLLHPACSGKLWVQPPAQPAIMPTAP